MSLSRLYRIIEYICALAIVFGICWAFKFDTKDIPSDAISVPTYFDNCSNDLSKYMSEHYIGNVIFDNVTDEEAKVVITNDSNYTPKFSEYTKYSIGYSPIIAIFPNKLTNYADENFVVTNNSKAYYCGIDIKEVIDLVINSSDGTINSGDLGFNSKKINMRVMIPDNSGKYRKEVVNSIITILADGNAIDTTNIATIKYDLETFLSKVDSGRNLNDLRKNLENNIILMPEYLLFEESGSTPSPAYWDECYVTNLYLYVDNSFEGVEDIKNTVNIINTSNGELKSIHFRNSSIQDLGDFSKYMAGQVSVSKQEYNFEELFGPKYWR